ncbi:MAG: hypothetical protein ABI551_01490 [Polyangiaceae bacterium]
MRKLFALFSVGAVVGSSFAIAACVGDAPSVSSAQGDLGGACFANGTCNPGLSCGVVQGQAACTEASDAGGDSSPSGDDGGGSTTGDGGSSSTGVCKFSPTPYPCTPVDGTACYASAQSCAGPTACTDPGDMLWPCNSANQCTGTACCLPAEAGIANPGVNCTQGTLILTPDASTGTTCEPATACAAGETQFCQVNAQCPKGQHCTPIEVASDRKSLNGTILAICAP